MKAMKAVDRANKAQQLLDNEIFKDAIAHLDNEFISRWRTNKDPAERERIWIAAQTAQKLPEIIKQIVLNGRVAKAILDDIEGKKPRKAA